MAVTASVDTTTVPITLTVVSDKRNVTGTVLVNGEEAKFNAVIEPKITDDSGKVWVKKSDDGKKSTYQ